MSFHVWLISHTPQICQNDLQAIGMVIGKKWVSDRREIMLSTYVWGGYYKRGFYFNIVCVCVFINLSHNFLILAIAQSCVEESSQLHIIVVLKNVLPKIHYSSSDPQEEISFYLPEEAE